MSVALKWLPEACILYNLLTLSASRRKVRYSSISPTCPLYAIKLIPPESARYVQLVDSCCKSQFVHVTYDSSLEILQIPSFDVFAECLQEEVAVWLAHRSRFTSWVSCCTSHFQHVKFSDSQWDRKCWLFGKVVLSNCMLVLFCIIEVLILVAYVWNGRQKVGLLHVAYFSLFFGMWSDIWHRLLSLRGIYFSTINNPGVSSMAMLFVGNHIFLFAYLNLMRSEDSYIMFVIWYLTGTYYQHNSILSHLHNKNFARYSVVDVVRARSDLSGKSP